jgi:hypothetical protein
MSVPKSVIRYLGYRSLSNGGRRFDFAVTQHLESPTMITVQAPPAFFLGPDRIAIQEASGICYETLKFHIQNISDSPPKQFDLTPADVIQHRKMQKSRAGRV